MRGKLILLFEKITQEELDNIADDLRNDKGYHVITESDVPGDDEDFKEMEEYGTKEDGI
jgi:hypothetical protein